MLQILLNTCLIDQELCVLLVKAVNKDNVKTKTDVFEEKRHSRALFDQDIQQQCFVSATQNHYNADE